MNDKEIIWEIAEKCGLFKGQNGEIFNSCVETEPVYDWTGTHIDNTGVPGRVFPSEEEMFKRIGKILDKVRQDERKRILKMFEEGLYGRFRTYYFGLSDNCIVCGLGHKNHYHRYGSTICENGTVVSEKHPYNQVQFILWSDLRRILNKIKSGETFSSSEEEEERGEPESAPHWDTSPSQTPSGLGDGVRDTPAITQKEETIQLLKNMPDNRRLCISPDGCFTREQLIEEVKNGTELGKFIIEIYQNAKKLQKEREGK